MQKIKFKIHGIKCENCPLLIEETLKNKSGVIKIKVGHNSNKGVVIYDEQSISEEEIYNAVENIGGFKLEKLEDYVEKDEEVASYKNPDSGKKAEPPKGPSSEVKIFAVAVVIILAFMFLSNGSKNVRADKTNRPVENTQVQQEINEKNDNPVLEAYIVSRCPFGLQMQRILADVVKNIPSLAKNVKVRYIGSVSTDGKTITAMHGQAEATENLRQICIREEQPNKYWDYVSCDMKSGDSAGCEVSSGVDSSKLSACVSDSNKGVAYAKKDFDLQDRYKVQGSPTLILNGGEASEFDYGGRTSEAVKTVICNGFSNQPDFCSKNLTTADAKTSFSDTY